MIQIHEGITGQIKRNILSSTNELPHRIALHTCINQPKRSKLLQRRSHTFFEIHASFHSTFCVHSDYSGCYFGN